MSIQASSQSSRFAEQDFGIDLKAVNISVDNKTLLADAHLQLNTGVHYGLLGRNGTGKSCLMFSLASGLLLSPELRSQLRIMLVKQTLDETDDIGEISVLEEIKRKPFGIDFYMSDKEKAVLKAELTSGARGKKAREALTQLEQLSLEEEEDDWSEEELDPKKIHTVTKSLKIKEEMLQKPLRELSGGWKMRVQLAKALLYEPDLLLLDEATNHLDIAGINWLEKTINEKFTGVTIVIVSHNRSFLNHVAQEMIVLRNQKLEYYKGNYDQYLLTVEEKEAHAERVQSAIDRKKDKAEASIQQNLKLAKKSGDDKRMKQVASKKTKMEERIGYERNAKGHRFKLNRDRAGWHSTILGDVETVEDEKTQAKLKFNIPPPALPRSGGALLIVEDVSFRRTNDKNEITFELKNITFGVEPGQRIAILGSNGQGKSTFLNLLADTWHPTKGSIQRRTSLIGYFRQDIVVELGKDKRTAIERLVSVYPLEKQELLWRHLGSFGLGSAMTATQTPLCKLSGGQRVAYAFAELTFANPTLLLLDEPNSHLDLDAIEALEDSLTQYDGGIVFVSHDISFVQDIATDAYWLQDGVLEKLELEDVSKRASKSKKFV